MKKDIHRTPGEWAGMRNYHFEPAAEVFDKDASLLALNSIAISLRRIADILGTIADHEELKRS